MKFLFLILPFLVACASLTPQSDSLLAKSTDLPRSTQIAGVPFVEQTSGYCGPATLAMAYGAWGETVPMGEVAKQVYTPGLKGTFQEDMVSAARRQGFIAIPVSGMQALLTEVSAGNPVIVFENLALSWLPQWHYAIVYGYDLDKQTVLMHSGPEAEKNWDIRKFERSWKLADYWGLVIVPPGRLSASAGEMDHLKAAASLEKQGQLDGAERAYRRIVERWPKSLVAGIGLGNIAYARGNPQKAIGFLQETVKNNPDSAVAWHNLAIAQGSAKMDRAARRSAQNALKFADAEEKARFTEDLEPWLKSE